MQWKELVAANPLIRVECETFQWEREESGTAGVCSQTSQPPHASHSLKMKLLYQKKENLEVELFLG